MVNLGGDSRSGMDIAGVFDASPGKLSWAAYDVAPGELLTVGAELRQTHGACTASVDVPAFSVVSVTAQ